MNVVAFSLFGSAPIYCHGAVQNALLYPKLLPGWAVVVWHSGDVPKDTITKLKLAKAELRVAPTSIANGMFWRFLALDDPKVERAIFRDCDSRPTEREIAAIRAWQSSDKPFHVMRDHPHHTLPLGGGLWGIDKTKLVGEPLRILSHVEDAIVKSKLGRKAYVRETGYSLDQTFLTQHIWPLAKEHGVLEHDSCTRATFTNAVPFPGGAKFDDQRFVGEIVGVDEKPNPVHWQMRINWMTT